MGDMSASELSALLSQRMEKIFPLNRRSDRNDSILEKRVTANPYDEHKNPKGIINLGIAWSYICDDIINEKLKTIKFESAQINGKFFGLLSFRQSLVDFYSRKFGPKEPLDADNLIVTNGLTSTLDVIAHVLGDPGDVFLTPTPSYAYFSRNFYIRSGIEIWPVDMLNPDESVDVQQKFELTAKKVEDAVEMAIKQGKNVRAFVLSNPSNPFGIVYPESLILEILDVLAKYKIHAIIDECSHLCIFKEGVRLKSIIAFDRIPDPNRTHVLWSFTKDLSVGGARISTVYSYSPQVTNCLKIYSPFYLTSPFSQRVCQEIMEDQKWCDGIYFPTFINRLQDRYQLLVDRLTKLGATVYTADGGFSVLVSFRKFLRNDTFEGELELLDQFLRYGVYILPGQFMWCSQPGWFRITFSYPKNLLQTGLDRIEDAMHALHSKAHL